MEKTHDFLFKILLVGDSAVGKTSLLMRYVENSFEQSYLSTVGIDWKAKVIDLDGFSIRLQLWDTAGQERFNTLTNAFYRGAMGVVLVYDITQPKTYRSVTRWMANIDEYAPPGTSKLLLANKIDLYADREVSKAEGAASAGNFDAEFAEVSAKTGEGISDGFMRLARIIKSKQNRMDMRRVLAGHEAEGLNLSAGTSAEKKKSGCC